MKAYILVLTLFALCLFSSQKVFSQDETGISIVNKMIERISSIETVTYLLHKQERIGGKIIEQNSFTKLDVDPFRVYLKEILPKGGVEVLYVKGQNNERAIVNPDGFPWINLKLDPKESLIRKYQHHTVHESGFDHLMQILKFLCEKYKTQIDSMVLNNGTIKYNNLECYSISMTNPYFGYMDYILKENESILEIAQRYRVSEHMILEMNDEIKGYNDLGNGQSIKIPTDYSSKLLLYIDKNKLLPLKMEVYDYKGLYEQYEFSDINVNIKISEEEFSEDYEGYGF